MLRAEQGDGPVAQAAARRSWRRDPRTAIPIGGDALGARTIGRIYGDKPDGTSYVCSGTLIGSGNRSIVWTAGHCLHGGRGGTHFSNVVFVPGHRSSADPAGIAPYGIWRGIRWGVTGEWSKRGKPNAVSSDQQDVGALVVGRNESGATITDVLGGAHRLAFGDRPLRRVSLFGYPIAGPFAGNEVLWACPGRRTGRAGYRRGHGPAVHVARCEMTGGASGGPWLTRMGPDGLGTVRSVNSAAVSGGGISGPVLGRSARRLFRVLDQVPV